MLYCSQSKIKLSSQSSSVKIGTLYNEFKNNKGLISIFFYVFYIARRLQFILTQIYLNQYELAQSILNISTGYAMIGFLIYYRPFKDKLIQVSNLACEICYSSIFTSLFIYSFGDNLFSKRTYQFIAIFSVFGCTGVQFCISLYEFIMRLKDIYLKFLEKRKKSILDRCKSSVIKNQSIVVNEPHLYRIA